MKEGWNEKLLEGEEDGLKKMKGGSWIMQETVIFLSPCTCTGSVKEGQFSYCKQSWADVRLKKYFYFTYRRENNIPKLIKKALKEKIKHSDKCLITSKTKIGF